MRLRWRAAQFFEVLWWRFYMRGKDKAAYLRNKKAYWQLQLDACKDVFAIGPTDQVIDVGCGPSGLYILNVSEHVTAVDPLLDQYEARLPFFSKNDYPAVQFIRSTIEGFTTDKTFDYVFCMNAINHVDNIRLGFKKLADLCNANGKIIVTIDAHNSQFIKAIFRIGPGDILHPHQYDLREYEQFLTDNGFKVLKTVCTGSAVIFSHYMLVAGRG